MAILSFVAVIGIRSYGNIKEVEAKKVNLANMKRIHNAMQVYDELRCDDIERFAYFDSLVDAQEGAANGAWLGTPGTYEWNMSTLFASETKGIYDGSWKFLRALTNANGVPMKSSSDFTIETAKDDNHGIERTGLKDKLGLYFISAADAELLRNAGIRRYCLHNASTGQASSYASLPPNTQSLPGGGPGFRPNMSSYYPADIQAGSPVAIVRPLSVSKGVASVSSVYKDLGYFYSGTNTLGSADSDYTKMLSTLGVRLVVFGIGQNSEFVRNKFGIGEAPADPVFTKKDYRQYLAVFALKSAAQGVAGTCHFVGILDAAGNTARAAEYDENWTNTPN